MKNKDYKCLDLFCGAGGLSKGFEKAGFKTVYAVEFDKTYASTFESNFVSVKVNTKDIKTISDDEINKIKEEFKPDIIVGGPPCQGFSLAGNIGRQFLEDDRNRLFVEYLRFVKIINPNIFVIENVAALLTHNKGKTIKEIVSTIEKLGYNVQYRVLNAVHFDVPQERRRIFIIGTKPGFKFEYPIESNKIITIKDAIGDLPKLQSGETSNISLHNAMKHSEQMLSKMSFVKDGGDRNDIPADLRPTSGDPRKYIRYNSKKPSFCVTGDMRKIFHYEQNRALTCRELARLQTFPDTYIFNGSSIQIQQQIGNAVPCNLAYAVAQQCFKTLSNNKTIPTYPTVNFIGNKEKICSWIIENLPIKKGTILDLFSGGVSVSYALKQAGYNVISNDAIFANYVLAKALIENSETKFNVNLLKTKSTLSSVQKIRKKINFLSNNIYFPKEVDELSHLIAISQKLSGYDKFVFLALLRRAMIRKIPYSRLNIKWEEIQKFRNEEYSYKKYGRYRHYHNIPFQEHMVFCAKEYNNAIFKASVCKALHLDAFDCIEKLKDNVDLVYLDPPYPSTMNNYLDFYGKIDKAFLVGNELRTDFTNKKTFLNVFSKLIKKCSDKAKYVIISMNNKCYPTAKELINKIKDFFKKINIVEKHHVYKVTGKKEKQKNYEILLICQK